MATKEIEKSYKNHIKVLNIFLILLKTIEMTKI
jgi:hypothetical protein